MPNNVPKPKKRTYKIATKKKKEKLFKVTLTLTFTPHLGSSDELEKGEHGYEDENNEEFCARLQDWIKTDEAYGTPEKIMRHVKSNDAFGFVESITLGEVLSAKWLDGFKIALIVKYENQPNMTVDEVKDDLERTSLEDGEYESSGDNGWKVTTLKDIMEYGLTAYRDNPIVVEEVDSAVLTGGRRKNMRKKTRKNRK